MKAREEQRARQALGTRTLLRSAPASRRLHRACRRDGDVAMYASSPRPQASAERPMEHAARLGKAEEHARGQRTASWKKCSMAASLVVDFRYHHQGRLRISGEVLLLPCSPSMQSEDAEVLQRRGPAPRRDRTACWRQQARARAGRQRAPRQPSRGVCTAGGPSQQVKSSTEAARPSMRPGRGQVQGPSSMHRSMLTEWDTR